MVICKEDNLFIIKIFKEYLNNVDIFDKDSIVSLFKDILFRLKKRYDLCGLFDIKVYTNDDYGMIMEVNNIYKYDDEIDVKINFNIDSVFLYEVQEEDDCRGSIYYYDGKYYSDYVDGNYDSSVIYKDSLDIIRKGIRIK